MSVDGVLQQSQSGRAIPHLVNMQQGSSFRTSDATSSLLLDDVLVPQLVHPYCRVGMSSVVAAAIV